jgi:hypothetical protein
MTKTGYVCSKEDLLALCREAERHGYNRQLITEAIEKLEVEKFVVQPLMLHEHIAGVVQPPRNWQQRCMITVEQTKKLIGFLDINVELWHDCVKHAVPIS